MPTKAPKPPADAYIWHMYRALAMHGLLSGVAQRIMDAPKEESLLRIRAIRRVATEQADEMVRASS